MEERGKYTVLHNHSDFPEVTKKKKSIKSAIPEKTPRKEQSSLSLSPQENSTRNSQSTERSYDSTKPTKTVITEKKTSSHSAALSKEEKRQPLHSLPKSPISRTTNNDKEREKETNSRLGNSHTELNSFVSHLQSSEKEETGLSKEKNGVPGHLKERKSDMTKKEMKKDMTKMKKVGDSGSIAQNGSFLLVMAMTAECSQVRYYCIHISYTHTL